MTAYRDAFPREFNRYIEPFLGSGAVFFYLQPKKALLSDINKVLIETYLAIQKDWGRVRKLLETHHCRHNQEYYYSVRRKRYRDIFERASQFIYLNRTCWNGLYRVNLRGEFNVPIGTKTSVILDTDNFEHASLILQSVRLIHSDFEPIIRMAGEGDFLFVDPPYTVKHNHNGFVKYNEKLFRWADQVRLRDALLEAAGRGAKILITNAHHESVRELYSGFGVHEDLARASVLAASSAYRGLAKELVIRSWL